jgi:hypothetical protein
MIPLDVAARNIGAEVVYRPDGASWTRAERGVITAVPLPLRWVFVRYGTDATAKATDPRDLYLVGEQS